MADTTSVLVTDIDISLNTKTVNPRDTLWQLVLWSTLNIVGALLMLLVLVLSMCIPHLRKLPLLLNYELILIFTCASASILTWTGHMYDQNPPIGLCIFNASTNVATTTACGLATLCLTISVWSQTRLSDCPSNRVLKALGSNFVLVLIPYIFALPLFLTTLIYLSRHRSELYRSPFKCRFSRGTLQLLGSLGAASSIFLVLVFCVWTTIIVFRAHRRTRVAVVTSGAETPAGRRWYRWLLMRVLAFGACLSAGFVMGMVQIIFGFSDTYPDIIVAAVFSSAPLIFGSQRDILRLLRYASPANSQSSQSHSGTSGRMRNGFGANAPVVSVDIVTLTSLTPSSREFVANDSSNIEPVWNVKHARSGPDLSNA